MKSSVRIIFSAIWLLVTGFGYWYCFSSLVDVSAYFARNGDRPFHLSIFFFGPFVCASIAYFLFPVLFSKRSESPFGVTLNLAFGIPLSATTLVLLFNALTCLVTEGLNAAFINLFSICIAMVLSPIIWAGVFGSGVIASVASRTYLARS